MNTQQIKYFAAVTRHLNFTEAARSVHLSQPALSKQIALLESELVVALGRTKLTN
ncbi:MAG: LysR family transcriptional regulator [Desulfobacteraceae bacterium]